MNNETVMFLVLVLGMCTLFSAFAGLIGFGIARLIKAPVDKAITWGGIAAFSVMTLSIAVIGAVMPLLT